jgi:Clp amino terminal domain, pathogenicity island component
MFERYTEGARRIIFFALYEARGLGSPEIDTEHLLLGLLREDKALIRQVLLNLDYESAYRNIAGAASPVATFPTRGDLPLSNHGKRVLKYACDEADRLNSKHIGTEHLLLGLVCDAEFLSAKLLAKMTSLDSLRKRVEALPARGPRNDVPQIRSVPAASNTVEIHGRCHKLEPVASAVQRLKQHSFFWERKPWQPRDVVFEKNGKRFSFDTSLAKDAAKYLLVKGGWKKDPCAICGWELFESEDSRHGTGFTNGGSWVCEECYHRFVEGDYFSSAYSDLT